jgi:site-specific DNA-methyltransferase (adenine-specific)
MLELNGFYNMDCMEGMKHFPDKYFELAIVDPPYGIGISDNPVRQMHEQKSWDKSVPDKAYFDELFRVSKNQIIWGANHFIEQFNKNSSCWIVWDKIQPEKFTMAMCELAWTSFDTPAKIYKKRVVGADKDGRIHPTQKPVALYEWLLQNYAKKGDKILDTHVGSASSLIACHQMGFKYVGFELDEDYFKSATARLEAVKSQISIFSIFDEPEPTEKWEQIRFI